MIQKRDYAPNGRLTCASCAHEPTCTFNRQQRHDGCWEPKKDTEQGKRYALAVRRQKRIIFVQRFILAAAALWFACYIAVAMQKTNAENQRKKQEYLEYKRQKAEEREASATETPYKTALEADVERRLSSLSNDWEISCSHWPEERRLHVALHHLRLSQFDKAWKAGQPHSKTARTAANAAFAAAEAAGIHCRVTVAVGTKDLCWESYRWEADEYKNGVVTTNGFLN